MSALEQNHAIFLCKSQTLLGALSIPSLKSVVSGSLRPRFLLKKNVLGLFKTRGQATPQSKADVETVILRQ